MADDERHELAQRLIEFTEREINTEAVELRKRIAEAKEYMRIVVVPNEITLWHINRILDGE